MDYFCNFLEKVVCYKDVWLLCLNRGERNPFAFQIGIYFFETRQKASKIWIAVNLTFFVCYICFFCISSKRLFS